MEHTKLPLTTWFLATYRISQAKTSLSSLALKRQLGASYPTAWLMHQKINQAMADRDSIHRLGGASNSTMPTWEESAAAASLDMARRTRCRFVAAISLNEQRHPMYLKLGMVSGFTSEAIGKWAKANLAPQARVRSDGLGCFAAVTAAGCLHTPMVVGALKPRDLPEFQWVNTVLGNLKTTLAGAFHR